MLLFGGMVGIVNLGLVWMTHKEEVGNLFRLKKESAAKN